MNSVSNIFKNIQIFILFLILFLGGLGQVNYTFLTFSLLWLVVIFFILTWKKKGVDFPPGFYLFAIFLIFFSLNLFWSKDFWMTFKYLLYFLAGFLFWLISYNLKDEFRNFEIVIVLLGVTFGILTIVNILRDLQLNVNSFSLDKYAVLLLQHHHIGDLWAVVLSIVAIKLVYYSKKKIILFILLSFGTYLMYISKSRSAFLSLIVGVLYLFQTLPSTRKYLLTLFVFIYLAYSLFLFTGRTKPTILARGYYLQGIAGVIKNPLGVGVGNFGELSSDTTNHILGFSHYSSVAMNIVLEMFAGMGVFAFVFLLWLLKVLKLILEKKVGVTSEVLDFFSRVTESTLLFPKIIFIVLTTNFMFDYTYLIPTMLWLWFISLGLSQD